MDLKARHAIIVVPLRESGPPQVVVQVRIGDAGERVPPPLRLAVSQGEDRVLEHVHAVALFLRGGGVVGLGAAAVFGFVLSWNDLFYALMLTGAESRTLPVAIAGFWTFRGIELGKMAVAILIAVIPVLMLSYLIQKHLLVKI